MSVNQTENKRKGIHQIGYCLKYLMTFLSPYKGGLILGLLMVVVANITFAVMPLVEGQMTTQLFSDGEAILKGVEGAHVHFDVIFGIMGTLVVIYIIKTVSQLITAVFLTKVLQQAMCDIRNTLQKKIQRLPVRDFDDHAFGDVLSCVTNDVDAAEQCTAGDTAESTGGDPDIYLCHWHDVLYQYSAGMYCPADHSFVIDCDAVFCNTFTEIV